MKRILITGSRTWPSDRMVRAMLTSEADRAWGTGIVVVHGDCPTGVDLFAREWAEWTVGIYLNISQEPHPAEWRPHGVYNPQAGFVRNQAMVDLGADICYAFIHKGSSGATDCARRAETAGIPLVRITID